jgi:hypothetical protein
MRADHRWYQGNIPLHYAAIDKQPAAAVHLVKKGANVHARAKEVHIRSPMRLRRGHPPI